MSRFSSVQNGTALLESDDSDGARRSDTPKHLANQAQERGLTGLRPTSHTLADIAFVRPAWHPDSANEKTPRRVRTWGVVGQIGR